MKFKIGDKVCCDDSEELEQPMEIIGRNLWFTKSEIVIYCVKAKHKKRGNELTVNLSEQRLYLAPSSSG